MTPYACTHVAKEDQMFFQDICAAVENIPDDLDLGLYEPDSEAWGHSSSQTVQLSCHILAEALSLVFPDKCGVVHGFYFKGYEHSWLQTPNGNIIDPYPVGHACGPILLDGRHPSPAWGLYCADTARFTSMLTREWFQRAVNTVQTWLIQNDFGEVIT